MKNREKVHVLLVPLSVFPREDEKTGETRLRENWNTKIL